MSVGFGAFQTARSGMYVNERGLFVTGHNISNVNTPGFSRQQSMIATGPNVNLDCQKQIGLGADIQETRQIRHSFLDNIYRQESTSLGYWETRSKTYSDVEAILAEPMGSGLQDVMNQFWDSWQELSKEPDSLTARAMVRQRGESLVYHINHMGSQLGKLQEDLNSELRVRIDEVNDITRQIADLNVEILKVEATEDNANDYRDKRNLLMDRLSELLNVEVREMQDGQLDITCGGFFLVHRDKNTNIKAVENPEGGQFYVPVLEDSGVELPAGSGIIKGLMESRGEVIGEKGSIENGTPNTMSDITFAVDVSNAGDDYLDSVKESIKEYVEGTEKIGLDANYRLVLYGGATEEEINFGNDIEGLLDEVDNIEEDAGGGTEFEGVVNILENADDFRENSNKYALVFTGEGGTGSNITDAQAQDYADRLNSIGLNTSVVKDETSFGADVVDAWETVSGETNGEFHNIEVEDFLDAMTKVYRSMNKDINDKISVVPDSLDIVSDLNKKLNALINILVREINYIHKSGKTLSNPPEDGDDFFTTINSEYPLEMENIKLNENLSDLNNIVASTEGDSGDNSICIEISSLRQRAFIQDYKGILTTDDYYQSIVLGVGNGGSEAERISENQMKLVGSVDAQRQSIMGVSMDEEMTRMMKYQFGYTASARTMNVLDEMIETVVSRMGIVGR
ncbi:flagellar hook-associated protein FlgK [Herbivorax sp. ANBcel31]|uniref:flagellar hook-associated protein FlgK n=1 Tax=Herbivorax sp. ANBcel31 TaxID=3069754 RepID=UPI0027B3D37E|nr:flagellar hook-associated protein FlgK [Herbivorax sp. ANBcel31]MDQ2085105.1 flagellar hook-associated protein FlgK [Herbivorax sp. ANBcel31]